MIGIATQELYDEARSSPRDATMQEIQLELIRRRRFNTYDGEVIYSLLMRHRSLWVAALLDRPGVFNRRTGWQLAVSGLIKLRDLDQDYWNTDTLFGLTYTSAQARELAVVFEESDTGAMPHVFENGEETEMAPGNRSD